MWQRLSAWFYTLLMRWELASEDDGEGAEVYYVTATPKSSVQKPAA